MSDSNRSLVFPMTAGDVVESVLIVAIAQRGDGPSLGLMEVTGVKPLNGTLLEITVRDWRNAERKLELEASTPILLTGISRR